MSISKTDTTVMRIFSSTVGAGVQAIVGIVIISASKKIAGMMFKTDDE